MNKYQANVRAFHARMGLPYSDKARLLDDDEVDLRLALIHEEVGELTASFGNYPERWLDVVKELCDVIYVAFGTAVAMGVDLDPYWDEVQRSNMTKVGGYLDERGKWIKPDNYQPADLERVWREQEQEQDMVLERLLFGALM